MKKTKVMQTDSLFYKNLMLVGRISGCHQLPQRSFFFRARQFPVCARCTGVFFGNTLAILMISFFAPHWLWLIFGANIMFVDWFIQRIGLLESSNTRRLITGIIGGYSLNSLYIAVIKIVISHFSGTQC